MKQYVIITLLALLAIPFLWPFFNKGYIETDDGLWAVIRQASLHNELRQGQFPVRWSGSLNFSYGYPLFNFSYPGPYYIGEFFKLIGFDFIWSVKLVFIFATIVSVVGMYIFARELWKNDLAGIIAALFYLASSYRLINLYLRGSVGEIVAFALFPLICFAGIKLLATGKRRYLLAGALLIALLIISHNVMALLFLPYFVLFILGEIFLRYTKFTILIKDYIEVFKNRKKGFKDNADQSLFFKHIHLVVTMLLIGIGLSAFFWVPALGEVSHTKLGTTPLTDISKEFDKVNGLFSTPFDNQSDTNDALENNFKNGLNYSLVTVLFAALLLALFYRKNYHVASHRVLLYLTGYVIALLLLTPVSEIIWKYLPGLKMVDFPWRMYGILIFLSPIIASAIALIPRLKYFGIVLAIVPLVYNLSIVGQAKIVNYPNSFYETNQATTTSADEYLSKWLKTPIRDSPIGLISRSNSENIFTSSVNKNTSTAKKITYTTDRPDKIQLAIMYFPGWELKLDGSPHPFTYDNGLINTTVPAGTHTLDAVFTDTPIRIFGNTLTITTFLFVLTAFSLQYFRGKRFVI